VIAALALSTPVRASQSIAVAAVLAAWFFAAVAFAATGAVTTNGFGAAGVGLTVVLPIIAIAILAPRWSILRSALYGIPLPILIGVNAVRIFGYFFIIHYAAGRLPAPFAPSAGWGDVLVGFTAIPVAFFAARQMAGWRQLTFVWNLVGIVDLVLAIGFGVTSAFDSPLRIFSGGPDTALMAELPMFLIPGFLVPVFVLTHLAVFVRLRQVDAIAMRTASI
jgi:hypothetical protein